MELCRCLGKPRWYIILTVLAMGWVLATSITAFGMYMLACHTSQGPQHQEGKWKQGRTQDSILIPRDADGGSGCSGRWTLRQGHVVLVVGSLLNFVLLLILLGLLILERRFIVHPYPLDPPPDYDSVIKEETPPPSFSELLIPPQPMVLMAQSTPIAQPTPSESSSLECLVMSSYPPPYTA